MFWNRVRFIHGLEPGVISLGILPPQQIWARNTVLVIIKLPKFPVPVRLRCGSGKLKFRHYIKERWTKFGAWWDAELLGVSPGSKLCATFLNIENTLNRFGAVAVWLRLLFSIYLGSVLYYKKITFTQKEFQNSVIRLSDFLTRILATVHFI